LSRARAGQPAARAGLKPGDIITSINGAKVKDSRDLARQIGGFTRTPASPSVLRAGKANTANITSAAEGPTPAGAKSGASGSRRANRKPRHRRGPGLPRPGHREHGLAVLRVDPNGKAARWD